MPRYALGLDYGTESARALLIDVADGREAGAAGADPVDVIGIGIDFTSCTLLPTDRDGTPLCLLPGFAAEPHAWVKLWKHHAAQPEAERINQVAAERGEPFLARYGGKTSSEWLLAQAWQILDAAPA